jgi:hypothetical protein
VKRLLVRRVSSPSIGTPAQVHFARRSMETSVFVIKWKEGGRIGFDKAPNLCRVRRRTRRCSWCRRDAARQQSRGAPPVCPSV